MTTIILPVDFSAASANAVRYAATMSCDRNLRRIILLYTACVSAYDPISVEGNGELLTMERNKGEALLAEMSQRLVTECPKGTKIQTAINVMPLLRAVHGLIRDEQADLVVVGAEVGGEDSVLSEQVIGLARISTVPVLVVPRGSRYEPSRMAIVVAQAGEDAGDVDAGWLRKEFGAESFQVFAATGPDPIKGVLDLMEVVHGQMIVVLPGRKSLFYRLTHRDLTKALARNERYPVLLLK